jgi:hypothetical protein
MDNKWPPPETNGNKCSGYLSKLGAKGIKTFKKRYFVLEDKEVSLLQLLYNLCQLFINSPSNGGRVWQLQANTEAAASIWLTHLLATWEELRVAMTAEQALGTHGQRVDGAVQGGGSPAV